MVEITAYVNFNINFIHECSLEGNLGELLPSSCKTGAGMGGLTGASLPKYGNPSTPMSPLTLRQGQVLQSLTHVLIFMPCVQC